MGKCYINHQEQKEGGSRELLVVQPELHPWKYYDVNPSQCNDQTHTGRWLETLPSLPPMMTLLSQWVRGEQWIFLDFKKAFHIAFLQAKW